MSKAENGQGVDGSVSFSALTKDEDMYRAVLENTGTGTIIIDNDMTILYVNAHFEYMTGYNRSEIENSMKWPQFVFTDDQDRMKRYHNERRKTPELIPTEYECRIVDKSGALKYIYMKVGMIPGTTKSIASYMDITERKHAEVRLMESESTLSAIVETFEGFIYITTVDHRLEFMNRALIDYSGRDAVGELCYTVIFGLDSPCPWCTDRNVCEGKTVRCEVKNPVNDRWYYSVRTPIYNRDGQVEKIQSILIDITDRKHTEEVIAENARLLRRENTRLSSAIKERYTFGDLIGKSSVMQEVYELILKAASTNAHVMINGESGTGKELVARAIHLMSDRKGMPFLPINCGAISETIIESEFFGYRKGAFTGADKDKQGFLDIADGGTLFLDEIGEIALSMQIKLLRVIEDGGYTRVGGYQVLKPNIRIIAATNRNLQDLVRKGLMRKDFYYRIHIIPIMLPPLRDRKEDLPLLIDHFMSQFENGRPLPPVTDAIMDAFKRYNWPGNIRELQNVLKRYTTLNEIVFMDSVEKEAVTIPIVESERIGGGTDLAAALETFEKRLILETLEKTRWKKGEAADILGIHRKTLFTKMRKFGLK